jgi:protein tyrosine phosphatase
LLHEVRKCGTVIRSFNSNQIIGYYYKSQPTPKPIYKSNRIVLGPNKTDESYGTFINANEVYPNVIATQCPLLSFPDGFANTLDDVKTMIVEQNVSLWISLAPVMNTSEVTLDVVDELLARGSLNCNVFPLLLMRQLGGSMEANRIMQPNGTASTVFWNMSYTVKAYASSEGGPGAGVRLERPVDMSGWVEVERRVEHIWYWGWRDFSVPPAEDEEFIVALAARAAAVVSEGGARVVVNCLSGRGRTGTFAALIAGLVEGVWNVSEVVALIVSMRRSRDGLVELPVQLRFVVRALGLEDIGDCDSNCQGYRLLNEMPFIRSSLNFLFGFLFAGLCFFIYVNRHNLFHGSVVAKDHIH